MPAIRADERSGLTSKGPGDDAADARSIGVTPRDAADFVEPAARDDAFVRGDLQHGIGGRVKNRTSVGQMLWAEFIENCGTAAGAVSEKLDAGFALDCSYEFG